MWKFWMKKFYTWKVLDAKYFQSMVFDLKVVFIFLLYIEAAFVVWKIAAYQECWSMQNAICYSDMQQFFIINFWMVWWIKLAIWQHFWRVRQIKITIWEVATQVFMPLNLQPMDSLRQCLPEFLCGLLHIEKQILIKIESYLWLIAFQFPGVRVGVATCCSLRHFTLQLNIQ